MVIKWWLFPWKGVESSQWCGKSWRNAKYSGDLGKSQYEEHPGVSRWKFLFKVTAMTDVTFKAPVPDHSDFRLKWRIWWPPGQYLGFLIIAIYNIPTNIPSYIFTSPTFLQMLFFSEPLICSSTGTRPTRHSRSSTLLKLVQLPPPANNGCHLPHLDRHRHHHQQPRRGWPKQHKLKRGWSLICQQRCRSTSTWS